MLGSVSLLRMPECEDTVPAFKELTAPWDDEDINRQLQNKAFRPRYTTVSCRYLQDTSL